MIGIIGKAGKELKEKPIRILQLFGSLNMGGAECRMMDVYRAIDKSEFQFDFVTLTSGQQIFEDEIKEFGGKIYKIKSPREIGIIKHIREVRKCLKSENYSAVHAHTSYHCGMVMLAAWLEHIPVRISHARTTGSKSKSKSKGLSLFLGRILINLFATKKLAISNNAGEFVFGNSSFEVLPNAIDVKKYQNIDISEVESLKNEIGVRKSAFIIGQIGRFAAMKNHKFSTIWFSEYKKQCPNSMLVFVGDGELKPEIERLSKELGIIDDVVFTGIRNDVYKVIHAFDVLLFPSLFEGLGGVVLEAQAAGIPVVESDSVPIETDMEIGLVQRLSINDDYSAWKNAVDSTKEGKRPSLETINQAFQEKHYTLSSAINKLSNIYQGEE